MKVKELINKLQTLDTEKEVVLLYCDDNPISDAGRGINEVFEVKGTEFDAVYIQEI